MSRSSLKYTITKKKTRVKNSVIKNQEILSRNWEKHSINWYPGHMLRAKKQLIKQLKRIDIVLEMRDARIPITSINRDFEEIIQQKNRILLFNKSCLADLEITKKWEAIFNNYKIPFLFIDAVNKQDLNKIIPLCSKIMEEKWSVFEKRGIRHPSLKLLIAGIPNVGKSSLINSLSQRKATKTGPIPGITRHQDWIKLDKNVELLDTPGILWPKIDNFDDGMRLSITGAIKDSIVGTSLLCDYLLHLLVQKVPKQLQQLYKLNPRDFNLIPADLINKIAEKRGFLKAGGELDCLRTENLILRDFRMGKLGRISFDLPETDGILS